jgi:hypothetical protein
MTNHPNRAKRKPASKICSICGNEYEGWGNNAQPINDGRCCDECNVDHVLVERMLRAHREIIP